MEVHVPINFKRGECYAEDSIVGQDYNFLFAGKVLMVSNEEKRKGSV
jgi:hypothetical protein